MKETVGKEVAEAEFERFAEAMDLDLDPDYMSQEDREGFEKHKRRVTREIMRGSLIVNDDGEAVYTPWKSTTKHKDPITFHERTGHTVSTMDQSKKSQQARQTYGMMAEMCRVHPSIFSSMVGTDIKVCEALFALLMD